MIDVFSKEKRHEIMASIKGRNTKPEKIVRSMLHRMGFRFSLHRTDLPGKPDIVLPRHHKIILVNGCFWHGHKGCKKATIPRTNTEFWTTKIENNRSRDRRVIRQLRRLGWLVLVIWQCEISKPGRLLAKLERFMNTDE